MAIPVLREAEGVEITVVVDNYTDVFLIESTEVLKRPKAFPDVGPLAEHGLSCVVTVYADGEKHTILMDTGRSALCLLHNLEVFDVDTEAIEGMVLSHGHRDHFGGLLELSKKVRAGIPLVLHPDAFLARRMNPPGGEIRYAPVLDEKALEAAGLAIRKERGVSTLAGDFVMAWGEVERITDFEQGPMWTEARVDGQWIADPLRDDQGICINVKDRGLVIVGGCSHAGIINSIRHAQKVSQVDRVHAVLGGFHLTGPLYEPIIERTIEEMKKLRPAFVVPMHCTGWKAINRFVAEMPDAFLLNCVGTTYTF